MMRATPRYLDTIKLLIGGAMLLGLSAGGLAQNAAAQPPADFQRTTIVNSGLDGPTGFEIAPDGRIFILERTGKVKIYKNGQLLAQPFADLPSVASGDRGLIGIAFDPDFGVSNNYVYFYYTGTDLLNYLVRFDASGDVGTDGPYTIFKTQSPSQWLHVGGSIRFGPDGKLYFAVGDNGYPPNAQNLSNPHGKILRINKDGTIPADNPFYGQSGKLGSIWAYGLRNPWRFQFDSVTGNLYTGDVGDYTWDEINLITKGGNYGWPVQEGKCSAGCEGYIDPVHAYTHTESGAAVTAGPVYRAGMFPDEYRGAFFFGDYAQGFIRYMKLNADGTSAGVYDFDAQAGSVVDLKVAPDGSLYYITYYPGVLYKVAYNTNDTTPKVNATADVTKGSEPLTVQFSSAGTSDPEGKPLQYLWDFGDGTTSTEANPAKVYSQKGVYNVKLTASNGTSQGESVPLTIQVGIPPELTIVSPQEGDTYKAGDSFTYNVFASDGAGLDINDANLRTDVILRHNTHTHPFQSGLQGRAGTFTIPDTGEAAADTWYEMKVTATDTSGLSTTKSVNIYPIKVAMTYATSPGGLKVLLDGVPQTSPHTIQAVVGFKRELSAPPIQTDANGTVYEFIGWSDGQSIKHTYTTPTVDTTYTANYQLSAPFKGEYFDNKTLTGAPKLVRDDPRVDFVWGEGSPDPAVPADNFSVRWTKSQPFAEGRYVFNVGSDDGVRLYIDGKRVIDKWIDQGGGYAYTADLAAGVHELRLEYYENMGSAIARLSWEIAATQPSTTYTAQYWNVPGIGTSPSVPTTQPALSRQEDTIQYDWGASAPAPGITADDYIVRWTKSTSVDAGVYTFTVTADDGVRVFVDGAKIIDKWIDQGATTYTATQTLAEGPHTITVEYYENDGGAVAKFAYEKTADVPPPQEYAVQYWNTPGAATAPVIPTSAPDATASEAEIVHDWGGGSPDVAIAADKFVGRWTKTENLPGGVYRFSGTSDDGIRIYVDDVLVLDKWKDQNEPFAVDTPIAGGSRKVVVEYYENMGGAQLQFAYQKVGEEPAPNTFKGEYFDNRNLEGGPVLVRQDAAVDFDWGGGAPDSALPVDNFSARWSKSESLAAGEYTFTVTADDGVRLYIDGELVLDKWIDQGATTYTVTRSLAEGPHAIAAEYYENGGGAVAKISYAKAPEQPAPAGYAAEYFDNMALSGAPVLTRQDAAIDFDWGGGAPAEGLPIDAFSARWTKRETLAAGAYVFALTADDGVRLYVDGELVIDKWIDQGATTYTAYRDLAEGEHTIVVEYYENGGGAVAKLAYSKSEQPAPIGFTAEYFDNMTLSGAPKLTRQESEINNDWGGGAPATGMPVDQFSVRWTKVEELSAGTYQLTVTADDGVRLYVDDELVIDKWIDQGATTYTINKVLTAGAHTFRIEYYERGGGAVAKFAYAVV